MPRTRIGLSADRNLGDLPSVPEALKNLGILPYSQLAPRDSPVFTGLPRLATLPPFGDSSSRLAPTSFVQQAIEDVRSDTSTPTELNELRRNGALGIGVPGAIPFGVGPVLPTGAAIGGIGPEAYNPIHAASASFL